MNANQQRNYEAYAPKIIEDLVDDLMRGERIAYAGRTFTLADLLNGDLLIGGEFQARLLTANQDDRTALMEHYVSLARSRIREWFQESVAGRAIIGDLVIEAAQEAKDE